MDQGCGTGRLAASLPARFDTVLLVDFSAAMLEQARGAVRAAHPRAHVDVTEVDLADPASRARLLGDDTAAQRALSAPNALITLGNTLCYVAGRAQRVLLLRELAAAVDPTARILVSNHVVPDVETALEALERTPEQVAASSIDALLDTDSGDGSYVHWFTAPLLAEEVEDAGLRILACTESEDGLRAALVCAAG